MPASAIYSQAAATKTGLPPPRKPDSLPIRWPDDPPPPAPERAPPSRFSLNDFGGFSPYEAPISTLRRRPQSVICSRPPAPITRRPHSVGAFEDEWCKPLLQPVPRRPRPISTLPSSRSDYQIQRPAIMTNGYGAVPPAAARRLSLPGAGLPQPKPSATFHGLSALLGYPSEALSSSTPATPHTPAAVREAVRHLLMQPRNGFAIMDHKLSLFIDILDAQERFSQVTQVHRNYFYYILLDFK